VCVCVCASTNEYLDFVDVLHLGELLVLPQVGFT
jgi:hypothetical protein